MNASQRAAATIRALAEVVRTAREIPSGHLYAMFHEQMTLRGYGAAIGLLKGAKLIEEQSYLLRWIGPKIPDADSAGYRAPGRVDCEVDLLIDPEQALRAIEG
jgi:hypothetical protein